VTPLRFFDALAHARKADFPVFLFLLNVITRLSGWLTASIWYDEAISLWRARLPLSKLWTDGAELQGFNLWEFFLRPFAGGPLWLLRLPAMVLSVASVYLAWLIMRRLEFTRAQITIAMIGLATLPGILWMSQDARYYGPMSFLFLAGLWYGLSGRLWMLCGFSCILILMHPTGAAWAAGAYLVIILNGTRITSLRWHTIPLTVTGLYKLSTLLGEQALSGFWLQDTSARYLTIQTMFAFYGDTLNGWAAILGLAVIAAILLPVVNLATDRTLRMLYFGVMGPIIIMLMVGEIYQPVLFYRTMQPGLPVFCILAGYVLKPSRQWYTWIMPAIAALAVTLGLVNWNPASRGASIEQAAHFIGQNWQPGDVIYYGSGTVAMPFDYYLEREQYLLDGYLNRNLSWPGIPFMMEPLENIQYSRAWIIYPLETTLHPEDAARLESYTQDGTLIARLEAIHFAPILIYLVEAP
jgi:hypothetical protein